MHSYEILFSNDISGGFYLRIEPLYNMNEKMRKDNGKETDTASNNYLVGKKTMMSRLMKTKMDDVNKGSFQFRYNPLTSQYVGECIENTNYVTVFESKFDKSGISYVDNSILDASYISEANSIREKAFEENKSHVDVDNATANFVNYGLNIKLYRMIKNTIIDNEKFMEDESILYEDDDDNDSGKSKGASEVKTKQGDKKEEEEQDDDSYG